MVFRMELDTDNAAFADGPGEVVRLLRQTARRLTEGEVGNMGLIDVNGNPVGRVFYDPPSVCRAEGCDGDTDDGDGWDGFCADCADRQEIASVAGE
jgi:hypothetical protein